MNNARRRMVVQKYNNRPPFDIKNKDTSAMINNRKKSFEHVEKSFRTIMSHLDAIQAEVDQEIIDQPETKQMIVNNIQKTRSIAPKILDSFERVSSKKTPVVQRNPKRASSRPEEKSVKKAANSINSNEREKDFALQTLYRNKHLDFGRNVPNHKLMKNHLTNYDEPTEMDGSVKGRSTYSLKRPSVGKLDKATSTTGMPAEKQLKWKKPTYPTRREQRPTQSEQKPTRTEQRPTRSEQKSTTPTRRQSKEKTQCISQIVNKDSPFLDNTKIISSPSYVGSNCDGTFVLEEEKSFGNNCQIDKYSKSFVSSKKYIKSNKNSTNNQDTVNNNKFSNIYVKNTRDQNLNAKKTSKIRSNVKTKISSSKNYIEILNSVKDTYPKLEEQADNTDNTVDTYDWSDNTQTDLTAQISFPKETRGAMERFQKSKQVPRTPLAKYIKLKEDLSIQPAISNNRMENNMSNAKIQYTRKTSPYTICKKLEPIHGSKESGACIGGGDHLVQCVNSGKVSSSGSRVNRKLQKSRGVR